MPLTILVTGGAGYVGSHTTLELLIAGHSVVCVDNLSNAYKDGSAALPEALRRVQNITGQQVIFYPVDIRDSDGLKNIFKKVSDERNYYHLIIILVVFQFVISYWQSIKTFLFIPRMTKFVCNML